MALLTTKSFTEHRMDDGKVSLDGNHCESDNGCCVTHTLDEEVQLTHHLHKGNTTNYTFLMLSFA